MATSTTTLVLSLALLSLFLVPAARSLRVPDSPLILPYHNGPLLAGAEPIQLYVTFYGNFEPSERSALKSFLSSLSPSSLQEHRSLRTSLQPFIELASSSSVAKWWSLTQHYFDLEGRHVSQKVELKGERVDNYSLGKHLKASDMASLARSSVELFSANAENSLSLVLTSADVFVEGFCMHACGGHSFTASSVEVLSNPSRDGNPRKNLQNPSHSMVPYAWVGNSKLQCPGFCSWPFAKPQYGPPMEPLKAPNGIGADGMVITLAKVLAGAATNPFGNAYYQGDDAAFGLEAGGACLGKFGAGAYPGFPGELLLNPSTGASYNMEGNDGVQFLVPWIWNPATQACAGQP